MKPQKAKNTLKRSTVPRGKENDVADKSKAGNGTPRVWPQSIARHFETTRESFADCAPKFRGFSRGKCRNCDRSGKTTARERGGEKSIEAIDRWSATGGPVKHIYGGESGCQGCAGADRCVQAALRLGKNDDPR